MAATKIFDHKRYTLFRSFGTKGEAKTQATVVKSEGRKARITQTAVAYQGRLVTLRWAVWVHN